MKSNDSRLCTHTGRRPAGRLCEDVAKTRAGPLSRPNAENADEREEGEEANHKAQRTRTRDKTKQKGETTEEKESTHKKMREIERKFLPANPSRPQAGPPRTHAQKRAKHTHAHKQKLVKKRTHDVKCVSALPVPCESRLPRCPP